MLQNISEMLLRDCLSCKECTECHGVEVSKIGSVTIQGDVVTVDGVKYDRVEGDGPGCTGCHFCVGNDPVTLTCSHPLNPHMDFELRGCGENYILVQQKPESEEDVEGVLMPGTRVWVSNDSVEHAIREKIEYSYVGPSSSGQHIAEIPSCFARFMYVVPVPETRYKMKPINEALTLLLDRRYKPAAGGWKRDYPADIHYISQDELQYCGEFLAAGEVPNEKLAFLYDEVAIDA